MSLEQAMQNLQNSTLEDITSKQDSIYHMLVEEKRSMANRIPEHIFSNYFLPYFLNEKVDNPNWLIEWISIAGAPTAEVAVINPYNEVLYYVPPVLLNNMPIGDGNVSYMNIFTRYDMYNNNLPQQGLHFLISELENKINSIQSVDMNKEYTDFYNQWNYILTMYGRKVQQQVMPNQVESVNNLDTVLDY